MGYYIAGTLLTISAGLLVTFAFLMYDDKDNHS